MPSAAPGQAPAAAHNDLDNYAVDDVSDDPFASPPPPASRKRNAQASGLGIDEEVAVQKRARAPAVKLDQDRLLGAAGIPRLRERAARGLGVKGKGHEFADAARLLSFYQRWLDDLFPKARFLDALAMVEKAGHKKRVMAARSGWMGEARPADVEARHQDPAAQDPGPQDADARHRGQASDGQPAPPPQTPPPPTADVPDDDDLYDATPRAPRRHAPPAADDDLDALIAEAEGHDSAAPPRPSQPPPPPPPPRAAPDRDDLDALIAEAEGLDASAAAPGAGQDDFADDEAAMQELHGAW